MRVFVCSCLVVFFAPNGLADLPELPLSDTRLSVGNLVREDIFAGWRANNIERLARAEKNIDLLLEQRPKKKAELLAWKGGATIYHAVIAHEADRSKEFEQIYQQALDLFDQARSLQPKDVAVRSIVGGSYALFGDRLPEKYRDTAWSECYDSYQVLWAMQSRFLERMPSHISGELLAGLIQSSQRTGRKEELDQYLDKAIEVLPGTRYATIAKEWKKNPQAAATGNISCKSCHTAGRLSARIKKFKND